MAVSPLAAAHTWVGAAAFGYSSSPPAASSGVDCAEGQGYVDRILPSLVAGGVDAWAALVTTHGSTQKSPPWSTP
jgi:hypothetical protein